MKTITCTCITFIILAAVTAQIPMWGYDITNSRHSADASITPANINTLTTAWTFETAGDMMSMATVGTVNNNKIIYFADAGGWVYALYQATGAVLWKVQFGTVTGIANSYSRTAPPLYNNMVYFGDLASATLVALNAATGTFVWRASLSDHPNAKITNSPTIHNGVLYVGLSSSEYAVQSGNPGFECCSFQGSLQAVNANTGAVLWKTLMAPDNEGKKTGYSGNGVWGSSFPIDVQRNTIYIGTGNSYNVPASVANCLRNTPVGQRDACVDPNNHASSIVALDLTTGAIKWSFKGIEADVWTTMCYVSGYCIPGSDLDYDFAQAPIIYTTSNGVDVVGGGSKSGIYWALNRDTGALVWSYFTGAGNSGGGCGFGSSIDDNSIYIGNSNTGHNAVTMSDGSNCNGGFWTKIDKSTGALRWKVCDPIDNPNYVAPADHPFNNLAAGRIPASYSSAFAPVTTNAAGLVFVGSMDPRGAVYALSATTGQIIWTYYLGGSVGASATISDGYLLWGSGYTQWNRGTASRTYRAFKLPGTPTGTVVNPPTNNPTNPPTATTTKAPTGNFPTDCWTCPAGYVHWWEAGYAASPGGDRCECVEGTVVVTPAPTPVTPTTTKTPVTPTTTKTPVTPTTTKAPVGNFPTDCWTCPAGYTHWWLAGYQAAPGGDRCACVEGAPVTTTRCPSGFTLSEDYCYKFVTSPLSYTDAQQSCRGQGAYLASITTWKQNSFVNTFVPNNVAEFYIGGARSTKYAAFKWDDSRTWAYTNFDTNQPASYGNYVSYIHGAQFGTVGKWRAISNAYLKPFLCGLKANSPSRSMKKSLKQGKISDESSHGEHQGKLVFMSVLFSSLLFLVGYLLF